MSATITTICGNVADSPQRRRTGDDTQVTNFRMAATERRFDGPTGQWVDGRTFWIDVACWNELGANVSLSISKGDPVIVKGQLSTDEWEGENGKRSKTVCTALSVGHDLSRGTTVFKRAARSAPALAPSTEQVVEETGPDVPTDEEYALVDLETGELVGAS